MIRTKRLAVIATAAALLVGLAACSGNGGEGNAGSTQSTLIYANAADPDILDPALSNSADASKVTTNVYENLVGFKMDGDKFVTANTGLAESWDVSDDKLTWTFHLREGVTFHDGEPFNADAVVYSFDRVKHGEGKFNFYRALFGGYGDESNIKTTTAIDEHTVEITLGTVDAFFLNSIARFQMAIVSPKADKAGTLNEHPVGTGPFEFVAWKKNDTITVKKYADYWRDGYPKLDEVIYKVIADPAARATALKTGEVDVISDLTPTDFEDIGNDPELEVMIRPSMNMALLGLNSKIKPFDKLEVRQAMNYAINTEEIVKSFYDGDSFPATMAIPPAAIGFGGGDKSPYSYDPAKAKQLLADAGYPDGFEIDLWVPAVARAYMSSPPKVAEYIQSNLEAVGIKAKLVTYDWSTYAEKVDRGDTAAAFLLGGTAADGTATGLMNWQFRSTAQGDHNRYGYSNPAFDEELIRVRGSADEATMLEHLYKAQDILFQDAPYVPLAHATPTLGVVKGLKGLVPAANSDDILTEVTIEK